MMLFEDVKVDDIVFIEEFIYGYDIIRKLRVKRVAKTQFTLSSEEQVRKNDGRILDCRPDRIKLANPYSAEKEVEYKEYLRFVKNISLIFRVAGRLDAIQGKDEINNAADLLRGSGIIEFLNIGGE